jgi:hypothetical protein
MKKFLLFFILIIQFDRSDAQSWVYHPFPTDSAIWTNISATYDVCTWCNPMSVTYYWNPPDRYCMSSDDTIINSLSYSKLNYCGGNYKGGLRDDGIGRVYFVPADSLSELLIYDFTVQTGDTVTLFQEIDSNTWMANTYMYLYVDSVMINGTFRKRINMSSGGASWIEGIGCTQGLFKEAWLNVSNYYLNLECMSHKDTTLYPEFSLGPCSLTSDLKETTIKGDVKIYPNPTTGRFEITSDQEIQMIEVMDLLGNTIHRFVVNNTVSGIDLSYLASNIYFLKFYDKKGYLIIKKVVKQ